MAIRISPIQNWRLQMMKHIRSHTSALFQICIMAIALLSGCVESLESEDLLEEETSAPAEISEATSLPPAELALAELALDESQPDEAEFVAAADPRACAISTGLPMRPSSQLPVPVLLLLDSTS